MSNPPEHIFYLSCREIFTNTHTHIQQPKVILRRLENCKHLLQPLLANYKLDAIAAVAKHLLAAVKFAATEDESESNAIKERNATESNRKIKNPGNFEHHG